MVGLVEKREYDASLMRDDCYENCGGYEDKVCWLCYWASDCWARYEREKKYR